MDNLHIQTDNPWYNYYVVTHSYLNTWLFQDTINNKPCKSPDAMTDDELRTELISRGLSAAGNRETMKETLYYGDESIPISDYITSRYTLTYAEIIHVSS